MVSISQETPGETEARLRLLIRESTIEWLPGRWAFTEADRMDDSRDAIAMVRNGEHRCLLVPKRHVDAAEEFSVVRFGFPAGKDNSGFIGWLASKVKAQTGTGVAVICGYERRKGGIYDYWLVPARIEAAVRRVIDRLATAPSGLDGVVLVPSDVAPTARITSETVFTFERHGDLVWGTYGGGRIEQGWLAGFRRGRRVPVPLHAG